MQAKILLAEDNNRLRMAYAVLLTDAGYLVSTAGDGEQALRIVERHGCFDVVVLDYALSAGGRTGGATGIELARTCPRAGFIVVSGYPSIDLPDGWVLLHKPVEREALLGAVEALLREAEP